MRTVLTYRAVGGALAALAASLATAPAQALADAGVADASACSQPQLTQPFMKSSDFNWYAAAPGMSSAGVVDATGWTLTGGAAVVMKKTTTGLIPGPLNLPGGSTAVSPAMCVSSDFQLARAQIKNLTADGGGGVAISVSYKGADGWSTPQRVGSMNTNDTAFGPSSTVRLQPAASGWQLVKITLTSTTNGKGFQLSDLATQASTQAALASVDTSSCTTPGLHQSLLANKDFSWYAMAPAVSGWTLSGGATVVHTQLADGQSGSVLNLPNKAKAVSPLMCVSSDYQQARAQIRALTAYSTGGVTVAAEVQGTTTWNNPTTSTLNGPNDTAWRASGDAKLQPADASGWQLVRITLTSAVSGGKGYQIANFGARASTQAALDSVDTSACQQHGLSQPFLGGGDALWYAMAPGEATDTFDGSDWTLSGGAKIASAPLADGAYGTVLDLPAGAQAVSPPMCVSTDYQAARAQLRSLTGGSGGVTLASAIHGTTSWNNPKVTSLGTNNTGWTLSGLANVQPADASGWQLVQFTLTNTSSANEVQLYNLATQASDTLALNSVDTSACVPPQLSQAFLWAGDRNWYTRALGVTDAGFDGDGWILSGGASIVQGQRPDGSTGPVLDMPAGSQAIAPVMCVTADYPFTRAQMLASAGDGSVDMYVAYNGTKTWNNAERSATIKGPKAAWGLSGNGNINPGKDAGWQLVQITLAARDTSHAQIADFQIDPRMNQ